MKEPTPLATQLKLRSEPGSNADAIIQGSAIGSLS